MYTPVRCCLWTVRLAASAAALSTAASPHEQDRAARFVRSGDRLRSLAAAGLLRLAAAEVLATDPSDVTVQRDCHCGRSHGRPTLPGTDWHVSVSHAGELVSVALACGAEIGVDVEWVRDVDYPALSQFVLTPCEEVPDDQASFFALWTRKEAVVKATGDGITAMSRVRLGIGTDGPIMLDYEGRDDLKVSLREFHPANGYVGALAALTDRDVDIVTTELPRKWHKRI